jgi:hypothetical protein
VQNILTKLLSKFPIQLNIKRSHDKDKNKIEDSDIPMSMRNELTFLAKFKGENKGLNEMEEVMNEKIPALISQVQKLRESLQTELKYA